MPGAQPVEWLASPPWNLEIIGDAGQLITATEALCLLARSSGSSRPSSSPLGLWPFPALSQVCFDTLKHL